MNRFEYAVSAGSVLCVKKIADCLPWGVAGALGALIGRAGYAVPSRYRAVAFKNLETAFGPGGGEKYGKIAGKSFENIGRGFCEILASEKLDACAVKKKVSVSGEENLKRALSSGNGVIALSAHIGNFAFIGIRLALEGYSFNYVFRYPNLQLLAEVIEGLGSRHGVGLISAVPGREAARKSLKCLRKNEIVCILGDQNERKGEVLNFFNTPAVTATGPAVLAMRTGAKIVPMFAVRKHGGKHEVVIEPEAEISSSGDYSRDVRVNSERLNRIIEGYVSLYPSQWWWVHRRWRV